MILMKYKVAVLGSFNSVLPFRQIGADVFEAAEGAALARQIAQLIKKDYALFFISEDALSEAPQVLEAYDRHAAVTIIPIPGIESAEAHGLSRVRGMVEKALGKSIL